MRIIAVTLISLFVLGISLLTVRFWGLGQVSPIYDNGFFDGASSVVRDWNDPKLTPEDIAWLDIKLNEAGDLKLENSSPEVLLFDYLAANTKRKVIINLNENKYEIQKLLANTIKENKANGRVIIQSLYSTILSATKTELPDALYGTSQPDLLKFAAMEALFILPAVPFKGDVFIAPLTLMKRPAFTPPILEEVRRRQRKIVLGPVLTPEELVEVQAYLPDLIYFKF